MKSRRIFTTKMGFLGLTTPGTEEGDIVVIFLGGMTRFIIRVSKSVAGEFSLVGPAYIHDIMYAKLWEVEILDAFVLI